MIARTLAATSLLLLSGCALLDSSAPDQGPAAEDGTNGSAVTEWQTLSLYLSRGGVGRTDYEQYRITRGSLVAECGQIAQGRHMQAQQQLLTPTSDTVDSVTESAFDLNRLVTEKHAQFAPPGDNRGLLDSGRTEVTIEFSNADDVTGGAITSPLKIKTNFDSLISPSATREFALQKLVKTLRAAAGGAPCDKPSFYGVDRH